MKTETINVGVYLVQVGEGFINVDDTLMVTKDITELYDRCALFHRKEAEAKARKFGGKLHQLALIERELD